MDQIIAQTSLPNLHPAIVHFPIVLLNLALLFDIAALLLSSKDWIRKTALALLVLGIAFAGITYWSGKQASESVDLSAQAQPVLAEHEDLAEYVLWFFGIYTGIRLALYFFLPYKRFIHAIMIALALPGLYLLFETADHGGELVYKHAVGVRLPAIVSKEQSPVRPGPSGGPAIHEKDFEWTFQPGDEAELDKYFETSPASLQTLNPKVEKFNDQFGLTLTKNSKDPFQIVLKPEYGDAQVEVDLDKSEFPGKISLIQHMNGSEHVYFSVDARSASLGRNGNSSKVFEQKPITIPSGWLKLRSVSAGGHFRGYLNGKLVVHGHGEAAPPGKVGVLLEGAGQLRIARMAVHPITETGE